MKTTNDYDTFIEVADDCPVEVAEVPPMRGAGKTAARLQFKLLNGNPYQYTSDDVLFQVHATKNNISRSEADGERKRFFFERPALLSCVSIDQTLRMGNSLRWCWPDGDLCNGVQGLCTACAR